MNIPAAEPTAHRRATALRQRAAVVPAIIAVLLSLVAVPAVFLHATALDTDRCVATVAPLATDPVIQSEITDQVTRQITTRLDIEGLTRGALARLTESTPLAALLVAAMTQSGGTVSVDPQGAVTLPSQTIVDAVRDALIGKGVGIAERIPVIDARVTIFESPALTGVYRALGVRDRRP